MSYSLVGLGAAALPPRTDVTIQPTPPLTRAAEFVGVGALAGGALGLLFGHPLVGAAVGAGLTAGGIVASVVAVSAAGPV